LHKYSVWDAFFWDFEYTTGSIATFAYIIMFGTSLEYIRRNYFEVFYYSHVLFLIIAIIFTCLHYPTCFAFYIPAVLLWLADRVVRTYQSWIIKSSFVHVDEVAPQTATQEGIVRILFESKLLQNFKPGQYVFAAMVLNGRKLWEYANWHPFTISEVFRVNQSTVNTEERVIGTVDESTKLISQQTPCYSSIQNDGLSDSLRRRRPVSFAADQNTKTVASIHIKALGTKTRDLLEASKTKSDIEVYIDGMYGPHLPYQDYSVLALFAAGIGATPAMSIIQDVVDKRSSGVRTMVTNHIYLSWAIRVTGKYSIILDGIFSPLTDCS
jgi:predicted ferric reductase